MTPLYEGVNTIITYEIIIYRTMTPLYEGVNTIITYEIIIYRTMTPLYEVVNTIVTYETSSHNRKLVVTTHIKNQYLDAHVWPSIMYGCWSVGVV